MAINEYDNPYVVPHQQTYKSQYVELPFDKLQKFVDKKQAEFDSAELAEDAMHNKLLQVQALTRDKKLRNELVSKYENEMIKNIEATGGDYSLAIPKIKSMGKQLHQDLTRGQLGAIASNFSAAQAYNQNLKEKYDKGEIDLEQLTGLQEISMSNYKGVQQALQPEGIYNSFSGIEAANLVDIDKNVEEAIKGYMADSLNASEYHLTQDGRYRYLTTNGWKTVRANDVYRDVAGMLRGNKPTMDYLSQQVQIEAYNAAKSGRPYDPAKSLDNKINQFAYRAASKAGFREDTREQSDMKADEYLLDRFTQGLKFELENVSDAMIWQSEAIQTKNPLTHSTSPQGEELTGSEGLHNNIESWTKQLNGALNTLVADLDDQTKDLAGQEYVKAQTQVQGFKKVLEEQGAVEAYKYIRDGKIAFVPQETMNRIKTEMQGQFDKIADARRLESQAENAYMDKTGFDPQAYHNNGVNALYKSVDELAAKGLLPKGVTADMIADAAMPVGQNRYKFKTEPGRHSNSPTIYKLIDTETGETHVIGRKMSVGPDQSVKGLSPSSIMQLYHNGNSKEAQKLQSGYKEAVDKYLNERNDWKSGGGNVSTKIPGYSQDAVGNWHWDETQSIKNEKFINNQFKKENGSIRIATWQGLAGVVTGENNTETGDLLQLLGKEFGYDDPDWLETDEGKAFVDDIQVGTIGLSQAPTLNWGGSNRRFLEMKVNHRGKQATVKVPLGTDNTTTTAISNFINNPVEQVRTRYWDLKSKGIDSQTWSDHPDVVFHTETGREGFTMPNPNFQNPNHPDYGKEVVRLPFETGLQYAGQYKAQKDAGALNPDYVRELDDRYLQTTLIPENIPNKLAKDTSFESPTKFRDFVRNNPNSIQPRTVYSIQDPESGEVYRVTGQQVLESERNSALSDIALVNKRNQYYDGLIKQGISPERAARIADKYAETDALQSTFQR